MKHLLLLCAFLCTQLTFAQAVADTAVTPNINISIKPVDGAIISKVAKESGKKNTLFYTFGVWCEPCRVHLPTAIKLAKDYDMEFYVLFVDAQSNTKYITGAADYLYKLDPSIKIAVLKDDVYGVKTNKRNKKFVTEITPPQFENIDDFSKYIVLDSEGKVVMVTTWKDYNGNWKDNNYIIQNRIVPVLTK